jgi:hypothetical protein
MAKSRSPLVVRAAAYVVLRSLKFVRHSVLRIKTGSRNVKYRIRESQWGNVLWRAAAFARAPFETGRRQRLAAGSTTSRAPHMDQASGYALLSPDHGPELTAALDTCRQLFESKTAVTSGADSDKLKEKRAFLRNLLNNDDLRNHPSLVDCALSDWALSVVTDYLHVVPYLNRVDLLYSVPRPTDDRIASQLFHLDPEGVTQVKFFINVFDTDDDDGPFTFIPADESRQIIQAIRSLRRKRGEPHVGRYTDEEIAAVDGDRSIIRVTGPRGSGVAVDTSRCLHLGSRVKPGSFRLCMYLQYCASLEHGNVFDIERFRHDPIRFLTVKHSSKWAGTDVSAPHQMT